MFELIRANRRKSILLMLIMLGLLLAVGFAIGFSVFPRTESVIVGRWRYFVPVGGLIGMAVAFCVWMLQAGVAWFAGDRVLMAAAGAKEIQKKDHPRLFNIVEEMTLAARLPAMPKVYIIEDLSLNAFASGRDPNHAAVAVTAGLLAKLNRDQLQGVIAHEVSHIANRDVLFMTFAGIMLGTIVMLTDLFARMMWYSNLGGAGRYRTRPSSRGNAGAAQLLLLVIALILAIVAPLIAQLLYFACSRRREYLADAGATVYTRYPEGLAGALEAIAGNPGDARAANKALAPMYIVNPLEAGKRAFSSLTSTHPPIEARIRILRAMAGGATYRDYSTAWAKVDGANAVQMPASAMILPAMDIAATAAAPSLASASMPLLDPDPRRRMRETGDLLHKMHQYRFIDCSCGVRIKLPPQYRQPSVKCPRCGTAHAAGP